MVFNPPLTGMGCPLKRLKMQENCPNRHIGSSTTLLDVAGLSCHEELDKSCWKSIASAKSIQVLRDKSLTSIACIRTRLCLN
jgi:hypothetical protein